MTLADAELITMRNRPYEKTARLVCSAVLIALLPPMLRAQDAFDLGVAAFHSGNYDRALDLLRQAVVLHPNQADPHSYLGATYMAMANESALMSAAPIPEADRLAAAKSVVSIPESERLAEAEFRRALALDTNNLLALESLVGLLYHGHRELTEPEKSRRLAEAQTLYDRLTLAFADDSLHKLAETLDILRTFTDDHTGKLYAKRGELIQSSWSQVLERANRSLESVGPLPNPMRKALQGKYMKILNDGLLDFQQSLQFDPTNDEVMIGTSYLIRDRAALRDTKEEYSGDIVSADAWMKKGFDTREEQTRSALVRSSAQQPSPTGSSARIRLSENDQRAKLIRMVTLSYPSAAVQAQVVGTVRFAVTIGRDGTAREAQPISGNPILFNAAQDALKQWIWKPTFEDGILREIDTEVEVRFSPN